MKDLILRNRPRLLALLATALLAFLLGYFLTLSSAFASGFNGTNGFITVANPANGTTGSTAPTSATLVGGKGDDGNLHPLHTDNSGNADVNVESSVLPTGAATSALQTTGNTALSTINTTLGAPMQSSGGSVSLSGTLPAYAATPTFNLGTLNGAATNAALTTINSTLGSPFQAGGSIGNSSFGISGTLPAFAATPTFNLGTISTAATAANQTTANSSLSSIDTKTPALGQALAASSVPVVLTAAQITTLTPPTTVTANAGTNLNTSALALETGGNLATVAANSAKVPRNVTGSGSSAGATVSTVATLTAPANAVGFVLMNLDTSTANIRWAVGRTASTTLGQQLQPGRDSGFVPIGANVSVIAESGTQNLDIQWIAQ